jgi:hypothetical protein
MLHESFEWNNVCAFAVWIMFMCKCYMRVLSEIMYTCSLSNVYVNATWEFWLKIYWMLVVWIIVA